MSAIQTVTANAVLGPGLTGLAIGLRVLNIDRTLYSAFRTTDVVETSTLGTYSRTTGVYVPAEGGFIVWGVAGTDYAEVAVDSALWYTALTSSDADADHLTLIAGATFTQGLVGLDISPLWETAYFTLKRTKKMSGNLAVADSTALAQIKVSNPGVASDGLLYLNAEVAADDDYGSLALVTLAGTATIVLEAVATVLLAECAGLYWDVKTLNSDDSVDVVASGTAEVTLTPTKTI